MSSQGFVYLKRWAEAVLKTVTAADCADGLISGWISRFYL
jgi:hypothetical protein